MPPSPSPGKQPSDRPSSTSLQPPATIISPPSPTDAKGFHPPGFNEYPSIGSPSGSHDDNIAYDSPEEDEDSEVPPPSDAADKPRAPSDSLGPAPLAATNMSSSPLREPSLLRADASDRPSSAPRSPSPSSPHFRPRGLHHRRTSSTHRVRETTDGHQSSTEDGARMINQYRIGESLGQGAYAKVEIAVDVGTGKEYAIKEFSKSRLHYQSLQEKHRQSTRGRNRRAQAKSGQPNDQEAPQGGGEAMDQSRAHPWGGTQTVNEDPLGLVRREIAVMKKLDHPNIKPDNVLLSADRQLVKLCDFGVSEMFTHSGDDRIKKSGGSPAFLSPESFTGHAQDLHGVTLYCMVTGRLPFNVSNPLDLFEAVREKEPRIPSDWEASLQDLIKRMLCKHPAQRIIMPVLREHPWVTDNGNEPMIETEENLYHVGKHVEEPTQEELRNAIGTLRGIFTVVRAVQKMRRLQLHRRSLSSQGGPGTQSPGDSTNVSLASGSMDSYMSHDPATSATSVSDEMDDSKYNDIAGDTVSSPRDISQPSPSDTARQESNPFDNLKPIDTGAHRREADNDESVGENADSSGNGEEGIVVVDSPVSDEGNQSTPIGNRPT
ncbi:hypothetical protein IAR55_002088 [Kwoniella newhampshirensis]|uniref:Protein kinase domain-containing protein n=1 Tax=Kwoniella newhampshirensis TaxID=1651941 RepID=A0AAW0YSV3_9TREE